MPELPEVETVIRDLNKKIVGYQIVDFWSEWSKAIKGTSLGVFQKEVTGKKILKVRRIGKNIFIDLNQGKTIYIHLKMTGHLLLKSQKNFQPCLPAGRFPISNFQKSLKSKSLTENKREKQNKKIEEDYFKDRVNQYIRHKWTLKKEKDILEMDFSDLRKFGKIVWLDTIDVESLPEIKKLGIDAMDKKFTLDKFRAILAKKEKSIIGIVLMDQDLIAGIGNIYRSEILFEAGVDPERRVASLKNKETELIFFHIKEILKKAIRMRGTSDSDYRDTSGKPGSFQKFLKVYRRDGQKCLGRNVLPKNRKCDNIVSRIKLGQRSVFLCEKCQK